MLYVIAFVAFFICFDWMQNNLISQAVAMEAHIIPDDVMPALNQIAYTNFGLFI
jgi:POT family proton-dependent oligopeptide transporter